MSTQLKKLVTQCRLFLTIQVLQIAVKIASEWHKSPILLAIVATCDGVIDGTNDIDRAKARLQELKSQQN